MKALFVPGLCCRGEIWDEARARLREVDGVALDWPWPERLRSYDDAAGWLAGEIHAHRPHFVVAHSLAGVVALHLRSREPDSEWALVVVDSFLVTPHPFFRNHVWLPSPALRARVAAMLAEEGARFPLLRAVAAADDPPGWRERLLATRATYVYGGRSGEHAPEVLGELAGVPAGAGRDVRVVPRAAHFPMLEQADDFCATLRDVLGLGVPRRGDSRG